MTAWRASWSSRPDAEARRGWPRRPSGGLLPRHFVAVDRRRLLELGTLLAQLGHRDGDRRQDDAGTDDEREPVPADEGLSGRMAVGQPRVGPRRRERREDREAQRAA